MKRRDFLVTGTTSAALCATQSQAKPLTWEQRYPRATRMVVDVRGFIPGQQVMLNLGGLPVVIRYRTDAEIQDARATSLSELPDKRARNANLPDDAPATDENRTLDAAGRWFVYRPVCTHLNLVTLDLSTPFSDDPYWINCPAHGGRYDSAGRVRAGPAPQNLFIPRGRFISATVLELYSNPIGAPAERIRNAHPSTW